MVLRAHFPAGIRYFLAATHLIQMKHISDKLSTSLLLSQLFESGVLKQENFGSLHKSGRLGPELGIPDLKHVRPHSFLCTYNLRQGAEVMFLAAFVFWICRCKGFKV